MAILQCIIHPLMVSYIVSHVYQYIPIEKGIILFCPVHFPFSSRNPVGSNRVGSGNVSGSMDTDSRFGVTIAPFGIVYPFHSTAMLIYLLLSEGTFMKNLMPLAYVLSFDFYSLLSFYIFVCLCVLLH